MPTSILAQERRGISNLPAPVHFREKKHRKENLETDEPAASGGGKRGEKEVGDGGPGGSNSGTNIYLCGFCKILPLRTISMSPHHNKQNFKTSKKRGK